MDLAFVPIGTHSSDLDVSTAKTLTIPAKSTKLMLQTLLKNVRIRMDGVAPTSSTGFRLTAGDPPIIIPVYNNSIIMIIEESATASLQYQFGN